MTDHFNEMIDAKGLKCPQPLLLVKNAIKKRAVGETILLLATDPHTDLDLEVWCERFGHTMMATEEQGVYLFWIKKGD